MLPADPVGYAHELYAPCVKWIMPVSKLIVVEALPVNADWATVVADRLRRAVAGAGPRDFLTWENCSIF